MESFRANNRYSEVDEISACRIYNLVKTMLFIVALPQETQIF